MSDNPVVQGATVPIPVRAEDVLNTGVETQWVRIDLGGTGVELRLTAGQKDSAHSVPVVLSSDQQAALIAALAPLTSVAINNLPGTQPVSATSLPLPTGAAQEWGNLATIAANTGHITSNPALETGGNLDAIHTFLATLAGAVSGGKMVTDDVASNTTGAAVPVAADYIGVNVGGNLQGQTGKSVGSAIAGHVAVVDGAGNQVTSFGSGTQYQEGVIQPSAIGTAVLAQNPQNQMNVLQTDTANNLLVVTQPSIQTREAADGTYSSEASRINWHEGGEAAPLREQWTTDVNLANVLGTQSLIDQRNGRLATSDVPEPDRVVSGTMSGLNREVIIPLSAHATVTFSLTGTWSGTVTPSLSPDGQNWYPTYAQPPLGETAGIIYNLTWSGNGAGIVRSAGFLFFRLQMTSYTSGVAFATLVASHVPFDAAPKNIYILGSQGQIQQRPSTLEQYTYDTSTAPSAGLIQNALLNADPWNPKGVYNGGDSCVWNGQVYQCIVGTGTNYPYPTNATYWQLDQRPNKSLVAQGKTSPPGASRLRVEQEDSQYLTRMAEQQLIYSQLLAQNALLFEEHLMSRVDTAAGGRPSAAGQNNSYLMEEIR